jgi:squalene-hopene/tetraprenyl-beta-curcumene cyclase
MLNLKKLAAWIALCTAIAVSAGCGDSTDNSSKPPVTDKPRPKKDVRVERALNKAAEFLVRRQDQDGAWRSEVYGQFKDGPSLTPLICEALHDLPAASDAVKASRKRAVDYLAAMAQADGSVAPGPGGWPHPVYTAALTVMVLSREEHSSLNKARDAWLAFLKNHQFTEELGWAPTDAFYGGWGYSDVPPRKPPAGQELYPLAEPNISATVYALEALRAAGVPPDDPAFKRALAFVVRCQNFSEKKTAKGNSPAEDGGFFFVQSDADRNKAGALATSSAPPTGARQFASYGTTTADGLRCLLACGLQREDSRVTAARQWLVQRFSADKQPGDFPEERHEARDALYYYYCNSVSRALAACGLNDVGPAEKPIRWGEALANELLRKQDPQGSWTNPAGEIRENDPLLATAFAISALARCGESK